MSFDKTAQEYRLVFTDHELFTAYSGKLLLAPGLVPAQAAMEAPIRIVDTVLQLRNRRLSVSSTLKIQCADSYLTGPLLHTK